MNNKEKIMQTYPLNWSQAKIKKFRQALLEWYDQKGRQLPWRQTKNPYYIWVSEIMLQQTQVDTVIPYYERFIAEIPEISDLAKVEESKLLSLWQGLGYYSRARNMQVAAQQIMELHGGAMPQDMVSLLALKGIGPYTAAAIGSICFGLIEPAMDGNLMRVISRLFEINQAINLTTTRRKIMAILYQLIDPNRPGDFNQALMDIGATIMTPHNYQPIESPLLEFDQSYHRGTSHLYPVKKQKKQSSNHTYLAYGIINPDGQWLMRQHGSGELLRGLWHFPLIEIDMVFESATIQELVEPLLDHYGKSFDQDEFINNYRLLLSNSDYNYLPNFPVIEHIFSHRNWKVYVVGLGLYNHIDIDQNQFQWITLGQEADYPISSLQKKLFDVFQENHHS